MIIKGMEGIMLVLRQFLVDKKDEYEKAGFIPTLELLIKDLDDIIGEPDRQEDDNEASREKVETQ